MTALPDHQALAELSRQVADQHRTVGGLRSLSTQIATAFEQGDVSGMAIDLARQASAAAEDLAGWLEQCDPRTLLDEVTALARQQPEMLLAITLGTGLTLGKSLSVPDGPLGDQSAPYTEPHYPVPSEDVAAEPAYVDNSPYAGDPAYVDDPSATELPVPAADPVYPDEPVHPGDRLHPGDENDPR